MPFRDRRVKKTRVLPQLEEMVTEPLAGGDEESAEINVSEFASAGIQLVEDSDGDWDSKVKFEGSVDGENYKALEVENLETGSGVTETASAGNEGLFRANLKGLKKIKISSTSDGEAGHVVSHILLEK